MSEQLIPVKTNGQGEPAVSGRELHEFLEVETRYNDWFSRMIEYGFEEGMDYGLVTQKRATNNPRNPETTYVDHAVSLDMAKEISMVQRTDKGKQARRYFIECEKQLRDDELYIAKQKEFVLESTFPAELFGLDEASSLMLHYMKPPFGPNHLKRWLVERGILCKQSCKNDRPIQRYLDNGWFIAVIHEWYRKGQKRTENRYYLSRRGVMGIIEMAIRENMLRFPAPRQSCLPGIYEERAYLS